MDCWNPRTRAAASSEPRYGSSPEPSAIRPQRGSRAMSTIGAYVQLMPAAAASWPAARAVASATSGSKAPASPSGIGKIARYPCITSSRSEEHTSELQSRLHPLFPYTPLFRSPGRRRARSLRRRQDRRRRPRPAGLERSRDTRVLRRADRKSTRLNSSHGYIHSFPTRRSSDLLAGGARGRFGDVRIERPGLAQRDWKDRAIPVYYVEPEEQRNLESRLRDGDALHGARILGADDVEQPAEFAGARELDLLWRSLTARGQQIELAELFFESHAGEDRVGVLRGGGGGDEERETEVRTEARHHSETFSRIEERTAPKLRRKTRRREGVAAGPGLWAELGNLNPFHGDLP